MTNALFQTPEEATLMEKPIPRKSEVEEVDPLLVDWNRVDLESFTVEKQVELHTVAPVEPTEEHGQLVKRLEELRHTLGDAWKSMEQTVDEAVKSISSGRDL